MFSKVTAAALATTIAGSAMAQDGGTQITFGLSSGVRAEDNWRMVDPSPGNSWQFTNDLSVGVSTQTRASEVDLSAGVGLHTTQIAGSSNVTGLSNPYARAAFRREGVDSALALSAGVTLYDQDIGFSDSDGERTALTFGGAYGFGEDQLFGGSFSANVARNYYSGSSSDDDSVVTVTGGLNFTVSPRLTISPSANITAYEVFDGSDTTTDYRNLSVGASLTLSDVATLNASVGRVTIDDSSAGSFSDTSASVALTRLGQNGSQTFSAATGFSIAGQRSNVGYSRSFDLGGSTASFGVGFARGATGNNTFTANANYTQPMQRGTFATNLNRAFTTANDGTEVLNTAFSVSLRQDLSETSGLDLNLEYGQEDVTGGTVSTDASVSASYSMQVAEDWDLRTGVERRISEETGSNQIASNGVFLRFERSWVTTR